MRRIVLFNRLSADGYYASSEGGLDWIVPDDELDGDASSNIPEADTILFGRKTYQAFESFWPSAIAAPGDAVQDPHDEGRASKALREMGEFIDRATKVVFSRSLREVSWRNTQLVSEFTPLVVEQLKRAPGKEIMIFGSGSIVSELTRYRLIDEYLLVVSPILLGSGQLWLRDVVKHTKLRLLQAKPYPSGNLLLRYTL